MARRKRISDEVVLDAAMQVMMRVGPAQFTLAAVSAVAGVSAATLVQRFSDKRGLIVATITQDNAAFARMLEALPPADGAAAVIAVFRLLTPDIDDADAFADQLLWLRQDMRDPDLNALARERFRLLREAVAERMPPMGAPAETAARLAEAQWQGALNQWGIAREGRLADYVTRSLADWFTLLGVR